MILKKDPYIIREALAVAIKELVTKEDLKI